MPPTKLPTSNLEVLTTTSSDFDVAVTEVEEVVEVVTTVILACSDVTGEAVVGVAVWLVLVG